MGKFRLFLQTSVSNVKQVWHILLMLSFVTIDGILYFNAQASEQAQILVLSWTFLLLVVAGTIYLKRALSLKTVHWIFLNYVIPFLLILVPLLITGAIPQGRDWSDKALFPSSGGLWVFLILFYTIVQSDIEEKLARLQAHDPDQWLWRFFSKVSFCFIVAGAMCYMAPFLLDYYGVFECRPQYKYRIGLGSFIITTFLPVFGMLIVRKIHQTESASPIEAFHP